MNHWTGTAGEARHALRSAAAAPGVAGAGVCAWIGWLAWGTAERAALVQPVVALVAAMVNAGTITAVAVLALWLVGTACDRLDPARRNGAGED